MQPRIVTIALVSSLALFRTAPAIAQATCEQWLQFDPADQTLAMRTFIDKAAVSTSAPADTVECLLSIDDQIALHATELCKRDGGDFAPAVATAIRTAIEHCQTR